MSSEWEFITPEIKKRIVSTGESECKPVKGWTCEILLSCETSTAAFKSEYLKDELQTIVLGEPCTEIDDFIEICIKSMVVGEESSFSCVLSMEGVEEIFNFNIKFINCEQRTYIFEWSDEKKLDYVLKYKSEGVSLYKDNKIEEAFYKFSKSLKMLLTLNTVLEENEVPGEVKELRLVLYNNIASCQLHFKNYVSVIELCNKVLSISTNIKALYRRGLANIEIKDYDNAVSDFCQVLELEPENKAALEKKMLIEKLNKHSLDDYKVIIKKMFK